MSRDSSFSFGGKAILAAIGFIFFALLIIMSFHVVPRSHRGVETSFGEVSPRILQEGLHFLSPWTVVTDYDVSMTAVPATAAQGSTKDSQVVHTDISLNYSYDPNLVNVTLDKFGREQYIEGAFIRPALYETFKATTAEYTSEELITQRKAVSSEIVAKIQLKLAKYNIIVSDINLVNFGFSPDYQKSIEDKVIAFQRKQKAEQDLARIQVEAQQAIARAQGNSESIRIEAQAIANQGGEAYIRMKAIDKWNGVMPTTIMGNGGPTPIFSVK